MWEETINSYIPYVSNGLLLRKTDERDVDVHLQVHNDEKVLRYVGPPLHLSREKALQRVVGRPHGMVGIFVAEDTKTKAAIGECGFIESNYISQIEISIMLLPMHQRLGYGRRILRALYHLWVDDLRHDSCAATVWQTNVAAISILVSEGFVQTSEYIDVRVDEPCFVFERRRESIAKSR